MTLHNYNGLTHETERTSYKEVLDDYFGYGSTQMILQKRHAILSSARTDISEDRLFEWFPDSDERDFFISCMNLIAKHYRPEKKVVNWKTPMRDINDDNPPWDSADDNSDSSPSPDDDTNDMSGTYKPSRATKAVQEPVAGPRTRPPVITYESVSSLLMNSIKGLN
jgi:hypothetical protein